MNCSTAALVAISCTGRVFACGGMTQIDPPSLQLDAGPHASGHDTEIAARAARRVHIDRGRIVREERDGVQSRTGS